MDYYAPGGIGDVCWALFKIQAINEKLGGGPINMFLRGSYHEIDRRALDFVRRFKFIHSVDMQQFAIHRENEPHIKPDGTYNYLEDGLYEINGKKYCFLIPNAALEQGIRLENWLPHHAINWNIFDDFLITPAEQKVGADLRKRIGPYAVFYPGPLAGNTTDGHNRNGLWKPEDWRDLGEAISRKYDLQIVLVGASYDYAYYEKKLSPLLLPALWHNWIGKTSLGELWSITGNAAFTLSYQAGVGIVAALMGQKVGIWWRPAGDSISPKYYLSFDEKMAHCWASPKVLESQTLLPLYYKRHGVLEVLEQVASRGWAAPSTVVSRSAG